MMFNGDVCATLVIPCFRPNAGILGSLVKPARLKRLNDFEGVAKKRQAQKARLGEP